MKIPANSGRIRNKREEEDLVYTLPVVSDTTECQVQHALQDFSLVLAERYVAQPLVNPLKAVERLCRLVRQQLLSGIVEQEAAPAIRLLYGGQSVVHPCPRVFIAGTASLYLLAELVYAVLERFDHQSMQTVWFQVIQQPAQFGVQSFQLLHRQHVDAYPNGLQQIAYLRKLADDMVVGQVGYDAVAVILHLLLKLGEPFAFTDKPGNRLYMPGTVRHLIGLQTL